MGYRPRPHAGCLQEHDVRLHFHWWRMGKNNPALLNRMKAEGLSWVMVVLISITASWIWSKTARKSLVQKKEIESITGVKTTLFAPPYGEFNEITIKATGLWVIKPLCSIDTIDWKRDGIDKIIHRVMKNPYGAMVLCI